MKLQLMTQHIYGKDEATGVESLTVEIAVKNLETKEAVVLPIPGELVGPLKILVDRLCAKYPHLVGKTEADPGSVTDRTVVVDDNGQPVGPAVDASKQTKH